MKKQMYIKRTYNKPKCIVYGKVTDITNDEIFYKVLSDTDTSEFKFSIGTGMRERNRGKETTWYELLSEDEYFLEMI